MNRPNAPIADTRPRIISVLRGTVWLLPLLCLAFYSVALGQVALPTASPVETVAPQPTATPVPVVTVDWNAYRNARAPTISLTLGTTAKGSVAARLANLTALASGAATPVTPGLLQPQLRNGVFDEINLGYLDGSGKAPLPANVTFGFDASLAGATVWIQPLDGGAILAQDTNGNPVNSPTGCTVVLNALGQSVFGYQAPALAGRYQVLIRIDNISSVLPFIILDPSQDN